MFVSVIVAATADGDRYEQAANDGDPDNVCEQQREHDAPESSSHLRSSLCFLTHVPPGVFALGPPTWVCSKSTRRCCC
jgi:hypothetical protein